jgi:hypothetical protein
LPRYARFATLDGQRTAQFLLACQSSARQDDLRIHGNSCIPPIRAAKTKGLPTNIQRRWSWNNLCRLPGPWIIQRASGILSSPVSKRRPGISAYIKQRPCGEIHAEGVPVAGMVHLVSAYVMHADGESSLQTGPFIMPLSC